MATNIRQARQHHQKLALTMRSAPKTSTQANPSAPSFDKDFGITRSWHQQRGQHQRPACKQNSSAPSRQGRRKLVSTRKPAPQKGMHATSCTIIRQGRQHHQNLASTTTSTPKTSMPANLSAPTFDKDVRITSNWHRQRDQHQRKACKQTPLHPHSTRTSASPMGQKCQSVRKTDP